MTSKSHPSATWRKSGTRLRRDTVIPQWFQASKAAAASDGHAVHCWVTAVVFQLSRLKQIPESQRVITSHIVFLIPISLTLLSAAERRVGNHSRSDSGDEC